MSFPLFCGVKYSLCCSLLSVWAVIQLILMGIFFKIRSPAFIEDLSIPEEDTLDYNSFINAMNKSYSQIGLNCFIAAAMYVATFVISTWQFWLNKKNRDL